MDKVIGIIDNLKNTSAGVSSVSVKIMKLEMYFIAEPISWLINCSFTTGVFPDILKQSCIAPVFTTGVFPEILKQSCITPVFKSGDHGLVSNYRPISILIVLCKIFEKSMSTIILQYASKFSILSPWQFGFRGGMSTCDAIMCYIDYIYESLNAKHHSLSVFVDLRRRLILSITMSCY